MQSNIKLYREMKRMTRPALAKKVGVQWETIKAYEVKGATPSLKVAYRIAKVLGVKIEDLYEFETLGENKDGLC